MRDNNLKTKKMKMQDLIDLVSENTKFKIVEQVWPNAFSMTIDYLDDNFVNPITNDPEDFDNLPTIEIANNQFLGMPFEVKVEDEDWVGVNTLEEVIDVINNF